MDDFVILIFKRFYEERKKDFKRMKSMDDDFLVLLLERIFEEEREEEDDEEDVKRIKFYNKNIMVEFDIGKDCYVLVQNYEGNMYIYIWYFDIIFRGKLYLLKKGIVLMLEKWKKLIEDCIGDIDKVLDDLKKEDVNVFYKEYFGYNVYVIVEQEYGFVDIRKWWLFEKVEMIVVIRKGIFFIVVMWKEFKKIIFVIRKRFQKELDSIRYCYLDYNN